MNGVTFHYESNRIFPWLDINQVEAWLNKTVAIFARLSSKLWLKNLTGKKKGAHERREKYIGVIRSMRSRKQKYKHKFQLWYTDQNLAQRLEKEYLCIYFARLWISRSIDPSTLLRARVRSSAANSRLTTKIESTFCIYDFVWRLHNVHNVHKIIHKARHLTN